VLLPPVKSVVYAAEWLSMMAVRGAAGRMAMASAIR